MTVIHRRLSAPAVLADTFPRFSELALQRQRCYVGQLRHCLLDNVARLLESLSRQCDPVAVHLTDCLEAVGLLQLLPCVLGVTKPRKGTKRVARKLKEVASRPVPVSRHALQVPGSGPPSPVAMRGCPGLASPPSAAARKPGPTPTVPCSDFFFPLPFFASRMHGTVGVVIPSDAGDVRT